MDSQFKNANRLSALPAALAEAAPGRLPKRERTRRQVIAAAIGVLTQRGSALATMQEIAGAAEVAPAISCMVAAAVPRLVSTPTAAAMSWRRVRSRLGSRPGAASAKAAGSADRRVTFLD